MVKNRHIVSNNCSFANNHSCCMVKEDAFSNFGSWMNVNSKNIRDSGLKCKCKWPSGLIPKFVSYSMCLKNKILNCYVILNTTICRERERDSMIWGDKYTRWLVSDRRIGQKHRESVNIFPWDANSCSLIERKKIIKQMLPKGTKNPLWFSKRWIARTYL